MADQDQFEEAKGAEVSTENNDTVEAGGDADDIEAAFEEFAAAREGHGSDDKEEPEAKPASVEGDVDDKVKPGDQAATAKEAAEIAKEKPAASDDPYANLSADELRHRLKTDHGRLGVLQRKINQLESRLSSQPKPQAKKPETNFKDSARWKSLKEEFPDFADGVEEILESRLSSLDEVSSKIGRFEQEQATQRRSEEALVLQEAHPDWKEVAGSNEFKTWMKDQPLAVQNMKSSQSAADAAWVLDLYKAQKPHEQGPSKAQQIQEKRNQQLRNAVETPSQRRAPTAADESDFDGAFDHFARQRERKK